MADNAATPLRAATRRHLEGQLDSKTIRGVPTVATLRSRKASISNLLVVARVVVAAAEAIRPDARIIPLQLSEKLYRLHRDMEETAANAARSRCCANFLFVSVTVTRLTALA